MWQQLFELVAGAASRGAALAVPDWLIAFDDWLTERLQHCTVCGRLPPRMDNGVLDVGRLSLAIARCFPCRKADPGKAVVRQILEQRYAEAAPLSKF
jgi:hypothetical protein